MLLDRAAGEDCRQTLADLVAWLNDARRRVRQP